ncbi:MAG: hypothetical protein WDM76_03685 [Limisphaerales bacterium]
MEQIAPSLAEFDHENARIEKIEPAHRTTYESAVAKMHTRLVLYLRLKNTLQPQDAENWPQELATYEKLIPAGVAAVRAQQAGQKTDEMVLNNFTVFVRSFDRMVNFEPPLVIPPQTSGGEWTRTSDALLDALRDGKINPFVKAYAAMAGALKIGSVSDFNSALTDYRSSLVPNSSKALDKARAEVFFNRMEPFYNAMVIYVLADCCNIFMVQFFRNDATFGGLAYRTCIRDSHHGFDLSHGVGRASAGDESLFIGDFHRLGRGGVGDDFGKILQEWNRRGRFGGHRLHHAHHRAPPRARRRHDGNDARGCWTRISGWRRTSSSSRSAMRARLWRDFWR